MLSQKQIPTFSKASKAFLIGCSTFLVTLSSHAEFSQFDASYKALFDKFKAKSTMRLRQNPETGEYTYTTYTKPKGLAKLFGKITESLTFNLKQNSVTPNSYRHDSRDDASIDYDWSSKQANTKTEDATKTIDLTGEELDLLSFQMQLSRDLKNNTLKNSYSVIKDNAVKIYQVELLGEDTYTVAQKTYKTIKIQQQRTGSSRRSVLQFAPELDYILVKMQQFKGDKQRASFSMYAYKKIKPEIKANKSDVETP